MRFAVKAMCTDYNKKVTVAFKKNSQTEDVITSHSRRKKNRLFSGMAEELSNLQYKEIRNN